MLIPKNYIRLIANKLFSVVLAVEQKNEIDNPAYVLAYDGYRIETKYFQHELMPVNGIAHYFGVVVDELPSVYLQEMQRLHESAALPIIQLQSAYEEYVQLLNPSFELKDNIDVIDENIINEANNDTNDKGTLEIRSNDDNTIPKYPLLAQITNTRDNIREMLVYI